MVTLLDFILLFFLFTEKLLREGFCTDLLVFFGKNDAEAETPVLWPPHLKSWLTGKDSCTGRDWGQEEKGTTEDEMAGWHHRLDGRESEWTPGVGDGQGGLACCNSWGHKESDMTERLNWTEPIIYIYTPLKFFYWVIVDVQYHMFQVYMLNVYSIVIQNFQR